MKNILISATTTTIIAKLYTLNQNMKKRKNNLLELVASGVMRMFCLLKGSAA